jgi:predicted DNA-binding transcriptional regulator AlpA
MDSVESGDAGEAKRLLSPRLAAEMTSLSQRHLARLSAIAQFPMAVPLGDNNNPRARIAYVESEVLAWIAARIASREKA